MSNDITYNNYLQCFINDSTILHNDINNYVIKYVNTNNNHLWFIYINDDGFDFDIYERFPEIDKDKLIIIHYNNSSNWKPFGLWRFELSNYLSYFNKV